MSDGFVITATSAATAIHPVDGGDTRCWCCDAAELPGRMVHLGSHPEVHLCLSCAHFVHQQAWQIADEGRRGPAVFARDRFRDLRAVVIRRGWHQDRFIGGGLRWLGRYLP